MYQVMTLYTVCIVHYKEIYCSITHIAYSHVRLYSYLPCTYSYVYTVLPIGYIDLISFALLNSKHYL